MCSPPGQPYAVLSEYFPRTYREHNRQTQEVFRRAGIGHKGSDPDRAKTALPIPSTGPSAVAEIAVLRSAVIAAELLSRQPDGGESDQPQRIGSEGDLRLASIGFSAPLGLAYRATARHEAVSGKRIRSVRAGPTSLTACTTRDRLQPAGNPNCTA